MTDDYPKYPDCTVKLSGGSGNAVWVFRTVRRELINYLWHRDGTARTQ